MQTCLRKFSWYDTPMSEKRLTTTYRGEKYTVYKTGYFKRNARYLHRVVWEEHYGPIPDGYCVHHRNHNKLDNRIENLCLLPAGAHAKEHATEEHVSKMSSWRERAEKERRTCVQCGETFEVAKQQHRKYCSEECRMLNWHDRHQPKDRLAKGRNVICEQCGVEFFVATRHRKRFCTEKCRNRYNDAKKTELRKAEQS